MTQDALSMGATPQSEYDKAFKQYTVSAPYRNVISLAAFQFDEMINQYNQLVAIGQSVSNEINTITNE